MAFEFLSQSCAAKFANTGFGDCCFNPALLIKAIIVPSTARINELNTSTLAAYLTTQIQAASRSARWFPIGKFKGLDASGGEPNKNEFGYGSVSFSGSAKGYNFKFQIYDCGLCEALAYAAFNGKRYVYLVDADGTIIGKKVTKTTVIAGVTYYTTELAPIEVSFISYPFMPSTGANVNQYFVEMDFSADEFSSIGWVGAATSIDKNFVLGLTGLQTFLINELLNNTGVYLNTGIHQSHTTTTITVNVTAGCDNANQGGLFAPLAVAGAWKLINKTTGAVVPISAVAYNATTKTYTITHAAQVAGTILELSLVDPTVLAAAPYNLSGWDSSAYTWTV